MATAKSGVTAKVVAILPARYQSTRLPGKPLLAETGKYLIQHVYEQVLQAKTVSRVVVATDDQRIVKAVKSFGGEVMMTDKNHRSGTDRLAELAFRVAGDIFINVQGDEPEIAPGVIDQLVELLLDNPKVPVGTLAFAISAEEALNPNLVKVVCDTAGKALYFSRSRIPFLRDADQEVEYLGHMGIYGYRREFLKTYTSLPDSHLERIEKLEQLRVLENGFAIVVGRVNDKTKGVDTAEDYQQFVQRYLAYEKKT